MYTGATCHVTTGNCDMVIQKNESMQCITQSHHLLLCWWSTWWIWNAILPSTRSVVSKAHCTDVLGSRQQTYCIRNNQHEWPTSKIPERLLPNMFCGCVSMSLMSWASYDIYTLVLVDFIGLCYPFFCSFTFCSGITFDLPSLSWPSCSHCPISATIYLFNI